MTVRPLTQTLALGLFIASTPGTAQGQSVVMVGQTGRNINCIPFGCPAPFNDITGYQQVFASTLFPGRTAITQLSFFSPATMFSGGFWSFSLAYTNLAVGALSPNLGSNPSSSLSPFWSGALGSTLVFVGTPFFYDPSLGNLLLDIVITAWEPPPGGASWIWNDIRTSCSRAWNSQYSGSTNNQADGSCLVTQIHHTVTPEPDTVVLLVTALGVLFVAGTVRRRSKLR